MPTYDGQLLETVNSHICQLGESPVWDNRRKVICWIDILNGEIHEYYIGQNLHNIISTQQIIGSLALCSNGKYITALQNGFAFIDPKNGENLLIEDPEFHLPDNRFNDGKCDPAGRFWAGTMSLSEKFGAGSVHVLENDLSVSRRIENLTISNGMAWSNNHQIFYYIDTPTYCVVAYDYDKKSGKIFNKKTVIEIPKEEGSPDGMTIDIDGMLWIAYWDGWQVTRWDPDSGKKLWRFVLPVAKVTSCIFGGKNFEDLYITTACVGLTKSELEKQPLAGSLFVLRNCGFRGMPSFEFKA